MHWFWKQSTRGWTNFEKLWGRDESLYASSNCFLAVKILNIPEKLWGRDKIFCWMKNHFSNAVLSRVLMSSSEGVGSTEN